VVILRSKAKFGGRFLYMVTAILVPIICIYFYWLTKKELKENHQKWLDLRNLHEEAMVLGEVIQIEESRMKFYYNRYVHVTDILLKTNSKSIRVKRIIPIINMVEPCQIEIGDMVRLYGNWQENEFRFLRYELIADK
jgi:hypothetical protein